MSAANDGRKAVNEIRRTIPKMEPFFKPMGKPGTSDWLATHNEAGQTFEEYLDSDPVKPDKTRQKIYVLPLGKFSKQESEIVAKAAKYIEVFYDLTVEEMPVRSFSPAQPNTRRDRFRKTVQVRTGYVIDTILKPILPADAAALIAFTTYDLFPNDSASYVFGQASLDERIGVWSLSRLDDNTDIENFLIRTLKIAAHETGHMFSMRHCTKYECLMSGTNHLAETDRRPIDACPECTAKICWLSNISVRERYQRLSDTCRNLGLVKEADEFRQKAAAVSK